MFGNDDKVSELRLTATQYLILAVFLILAWGLWSLQVMKSDYYSLAAEKNRIRNVPVLAPRGRILDREGRTIVDNYPSFTALLLRDSSRDLTTDADLIAQGLHLNPDDVRTRIKRAAWMPQYQPIFLKEDITPDELQFIEAHRNELPELDTIMSHRRLYPRNGFMAHLIGYVGEVSEDMLNQPQFELYNAGDVVGVSGVERQYNALLMGTNGSRQALVDSHGREVGRLGETEAIAGKPLKLTVDIDLQIAAEEALEGKNGAIIAMDPHTGEILAMVSGPTYDPNDFAVRVSRDEWNHLVTDPDKPLLNKAIQAQLAPGSTFKISCLSRDGRKALRRTCTSTARAPPSSMDAVSDAGSKAATAPSISKKPSINRATYFFYNLAEKLGIDRIAKYATQFGLGQKTGIDLPNEVAGIMPSEEWKIRNFKQKWFAGETISVGIGQGAIAITPVQLLRAISAISMGGRMVVPHVINPSDVPPNFVEASRYTEVKSIPWTPTDGTTSPTPCRACCYPKARLPRPTFPASTSPARPARRRSYRWQRAQATKTAKNLAQNGWFVGFTPRRNPDIVVCVLFQGGEHGRLAARTRDAGNQGLRREATAHAAENGRQTQRQRRHRRPLDRPRSRRRQRSKKQRRVER